MVTPSCIAPGTASPEEAVKLAAYVERLTRYLTLPLTERLFGDEDVTDIQINSDGLVWLDRHLARSDEAALFRVLRKGSLPVCERFYP